MDAPVDLTSAAHLLDRSEVLYQTGRDGRVAWVSPNVEELLGWAPEELLGGVVLDLLHPDDRPALAEKRLAAYTTGEPLDCREVRVRTSSGAYRAVSFRMRPFRDGGQVVGAFVVVRDAHEASSTLRALRTLSIGNGVLVRARDEQELLEEMCRTVAEVGGYTLAWYGRPDPAGTAVVPVARYGPGSAYVDEIRVTYDDSPTGRGPTGVALRTGTTQVRRDFASPDHAPWREVAHRHGIRSSICLPVTVDGSVDGGLMVYSTEPGAFDPVAQALLEDLSADVGYGIARLRDAQRLTEALQSSVFVLAAAVESRDPYTAGHQSQVGILAEAIGRELHLDEDRIHGLVLGASIHDLGKISIDERTLIKPGTLTESEWATLKAHPVTGHRIVSRFPWPWPIADMILQHHERMDGSGYPHGLRGDAILLESRIIAVADIYEAMANDRPYRDAPGSDRAAHTIRTGRGVLYDPDVVDAFERVLARGFRFPRTG